MAKQNNAAAKAKAEELLKKAVALAESQGIEITEDDDLESIEKKLANKGIESTSSGEDALGEAPATLEYSGGENPPGIPRKAYQVKATDDEVKMYQSKGKLVGYNEKTKLAWIIPALIMLFGSVAFADTDGTEESVMGNRRWKITSSGNLEPVTDSAVKIGASGAEVSQIYVDTLTTAVVATTGNNTLGDTAATSSTSGDKTTIVGSLYIPYLSKTAKPASGLAEGTIILTKGLRRDDCGHGTAGNSNVYTVCFSDGTNWIPL